MIELSRNSQKAAQLDLIHNQLASVCMLNNDKSNLSQSHFNGLNAVSGVPFHPPFYNASLNVCFCRFFTPVVIIPVVCVVGLGLFERGFPEVGKCVEIGLPMLILLVGCQQYLKNIHERVHFFLERFALLFCIMIIWSFAAVLTAGGAYNNVPEKTKVHCRTDRSHLMSSAPWIRIPYPFQWGAPIFVASHVFGMMGAVFVSAAEEFSGALEKNLERRRSRHEVPRVFHSTGAYLAAARLSGATPPPAHVLSRSVGLQGIGMLLEGIFGAAVGSTASVENVGLLGLTRVGSRRAVQISTFFMIFFSIFAAVGVSFMQFANHSSMRNLYILGVSLFLGISVPEYFKDFSASAGHGPVKTSAGWFDEILNSIFSSPVTVALMVGTLLDNTLEAKHAAADRGIAWWAPFQMRKGDVRNDEYYSYTFKIKEYIPTRFL
ncbi:hypothetical protein ACLOJK_038717 [Asimina triloba]